MSEFYPKLRPHSQLHPDSEKMALAGNIVHRLVMYHSLQLFGHIQKMSLNYYNLYQFLL